MHLGKCVFPLFRLATMGEILAIPLRLAQIAADIHGKMKPMDSKCLFKISAEMHFVKMSASLSAEATFSTFRSPFATAS